MRESTKIRVPPERAGMRADAFLSLALPFLSRTLIKRKVQQGEALLGARRFATSTRLRAGDEIEVFWRGAVPGPGLPGSAPAEGPSLPVLFEDEYYLAVDKPAGMLSHPVGAAQSGTAIQIVRAMLAEETAAALAAGDRDRYPTLAGRLDRLTSGVLLVAKSRQALVAVQRLRSRGGLRRSYRAVVEGTMEHDEGSIELPLGPDPGSRARIRMAVRPDGLRCRTDYRVIRRFAACSEIEAFPATGRQHQIRAHLAAIGHPVVGDLLYRDEELFLRYLQQGRRLDPSARHLLHAESLSFLHPFTGARVEVIAAPPPDYSAAITKLSAG